MANYMQYGRGYLGGQQKDSRCANGGAAARTSEDCSDCCARSSNLLLIGLQLYFIGDFMANQFYPCTRRRRRGSIDDKRDNARQGRRREEGGALAT